MSGRPCPYGLIKIIGLKAKWSQERTEKVGLIKAGLPRL